VGNITKQRMTCTWRPIVFVDYDSVPKATMVSYDVSNQCYGEKPAGKVLLVIQSELGSNLTLLGQLMLDILIQFRKRAQSQHLKTLPTFGMFCWMILKMHHYEFLTASTHIRIDF